MYTIYISKYEKDGVRVDTPLCIYDKRSPAEDMRCMDPQLNLVDSRAGDLSITLPLGHYAYDYILKGVTLISMYRLDASQTPGQYTEKLMFEGPIRKISKTFKKDKILYAEGFFSFLNESIQPEKQYFNVTLEEYMAGMITEHNSRMTGDNVYKQFTLGTVEIDFPDGEETNDHRTEFEATQYGSTMDYFLALQNAYGGHFIFSKVEGVYRIDYLRNIPKNNTQSIMFGENLLDFVTEDDTSNICTCCVPVSQVNTTSLGMAGDILVSSNLTKHIAGTTWVDVTTDDMGRDLSGQGCKALVLDPEGSKTDIYNGDSGNVIAYYYNGRVLEQDPNDNTPGTYQISDYSSSYNPIFFVVRYFVTYKDERLYISSRISGHLSRGLWCYYAYNGSYGGSHGNDILAYEGYVPNQNEPDLYTAIDKELDMSYTSYGQNLYVSRENQNPKTVGELNVAGQLSSYMSFSAATPIEIKRARYAYSKNPEAGEEITNVSVLYNQALMKNSSEDHGQVNKYFPIIPTGSDGHFGVVVCSIPEDAEAILITTRAKDAGFPKEYYESYTSDCLWALFSSDGSDIQASSVDYNMLLNCMQLNHAKLDNQKFTSRINEKIDLTSEENKGGRILLLSEWSLRGPGEANPGSAMVIPVVRYCNKYVDRLTNYVTADGADADRYHEANSIYVKDPDLIAKYGYSEKRLEFNGIENPNILVKRTEAYITDNQFGKMTIDVKGLDMHDLDINVDAFDISTAVQIISQPHGLDQYFDIKELTIAPDSPESNEITFNEDEEGRYTGTLPCSILMATQQLRDFTVFGTPEGLVDPNSVEHPYYITITLTNLSTDESKTYTIERGNALKFPNKVIFEDELTPGVLDTHISGLVEITINAVDTMDTSIKPTVQFRYDKVKDGQ